ncbi:MAG: PAS domain-containing sensor histidine kinase [Candidatus Electrothrix sp. AR3]|nr:PAS domain-containing sensor histidine kinase [Candidatus Electrothrix sp. AR3]
MPDNRLELIQSVIIAKLPVALFAVDADYKIIEFNPAAEKLTGMLRTEVMGYNCSEILCSNLCEQSCPFHESIKTGVPCIDREAVFRVHGEKKLPVILSSQAIKDQNGQLICGIEVFWDATATQEQAAHKRNLISLFTHDLKAPVAITGGFVSRLLKGKAGPLNKKQTQYLQIIEREIHRQEEYIHAFLDIAKIEAGQIELKLEPCELEGLLHEIVTGFRVQAATKEIDLELYLPPQLGSTNLDRLQIYRALSNLLDNAIKYSQERSVVQLRIEQEENQVVLEICDQGPGISMHNQASIFDHYFRTPDSSRTVQGSGLGLAAVKAIIEAHSGSIWVHSTPGKGCTFFISLPC